MTPVEAGAAEAEEEPGAGPWCLACSDAVDSSKVCMRANVAAAEASAAALAASAAWEDPRPCLKWIKGFVGRRGGTD